MEPQTQNAQKIHMISLGCARNRVDSEVMLGTLLGDGWAVAEADTADAIIINTCGFIEAAKEESVDRILECAELKKDRPNLKLVVAGCLTQRYKKQLAKGLPEVDLFVGTDEFHKIDNFLKNPEPSGTIHAKRTHYLYNESLPRVNTLAARSAYVKVAEGCQHNCAFCIIPAIRGRLRSRPITSVVKEVQDLVARGVLEVNLIAQDLAAYGRDWDTRASDESHLLSLCKELCAIEGLKWLRLLYVYPENISDEFLEFMATEPKLVKYLDIPVQHASDAVLARMDRQIDAQGLKTIFRKVRAKLPEMTLRTSVMVGFPGETEQDFSELLEFVREMEFDHLGCFRYSQEEGTKAARYPDQIDDAVKEERYDRIMTVQQQVSKKRLASKVGRAFDVLIEGPCNDNPYLFQGRLSGQAPEVDGLVFINDGPVEVGSIQKVEITDSFEYDLVGHVLA